MTLTRDDAWALVSDWTKNEALIIHARMVETVMRAAALKYGAGESDVERWGLTGLLHDADYDQWSDEHPNRVVAWLEEHGEADIAHAVRCHYTIWGHQCETAMDKALLACDELTGFVGACCFVRPDGIASLKPKSVKKKLKDKSFAAKVDRNEIRLGCEQLGVELDEHIQFIIDALKPHAEEFGLQGSGG